MFSDQDPVQAGSLVRQTVDWISLTLGANGSSLPAEIDISRLTAPPAFAGDLVELVRKVLDNSHEGRYLPLAMERLQFGADADDELPRFRAAAQIVVILAGGQHRRDTLNCRSGQDLGCRDPSGCSSNL